VVWRADIVLATADGLGTNAIMRRTGKSKPCVWRWQERYIDEGVPGLLRDRTRPSRIAPLLAEKKLAIIEKTATEKPANATHWSARKMAKAVGVSHRSVQRVWAGAGVKPHLVRSFKLSNEPLLHRLRRVLFLCGTRRRRSFRFVRRLHRYYGGVRLLGSVHHRLRLLAFPMRTAVLRTHPTTTARPETSQVPVRSLCT
jgi:transposase